MQLEVHECGAHQTNQDDELCAHGLGDSDYSYMSKAQITPNDVADATAVCSRDSLKSRYPEDMRQ